MEVDRQPDDDVHTEHQQQQQQLSAGSIITGRSFADKTSSIDALGFSADYKLSLIHI